MSFGKRLRAARLRKGLTQKQLAELIRVKHNSVSDWELDKNKPYADTMELIMEALEVDANTLLGWDNPEQINKDVDDLLNKFLANPKIRDILPIINKLKGKDLEMVLNFIKRLGD